MKLSRLLKKAHLLRCPRRHSLRRTNQVRLSRPPRAASHLDLFEQPEEKRVFQQPTSILACLSLLLLMSLSIPGCKKGAPPMQEGKYATIEMEKGGKIVIEFHPDSAPKTVENFLKLTREGFYDGLTFHRVEPGFVVQGGDPRGNGTGGPGYLIPAEFNDRPHVTGTVAMARSADPDSAGSQFYICLAPQPFLDRNYTVFGQVIEGMDVVSQIQRGDRMKRVMVGKP